MKRHLKLPVVAPNASPRLCGPCGGKCCKNFPGIYHPGQFPDVESIVSALHRGDTVVDNWPWYVISASGLLKWGPENGDLFYLRPRIKRRSGPVDSAFGREGSACIHHSPSKGCRLPKEDRPLGCNALVPREPDEGCSIAQPFIDSTVKAWAKHQDTVLLALDQVLPALGAPRE